MGKALIVSVTFHVIVIALLIVCPSGNVKKHPETITVFLTDAGPPGGRGAAGKAGPVRVGMKLRSPTHAKQSRSPERGALGAGHSRNHEAFCAETGNGQRDANEKDRHGGRKPDIIYVLCRAADGVCGPGRRRRKDAARAPGREQGSRAPEKAKAAQAPSGPPMVQMRGKKQYLEGNFGYIRDLIVKNLKYPYVARRMGWKGSVTVAFVILENGNVEAIRVTQSSGHDLLDQSVLKTVRALQPFPRPPVRAELIIPIAFRLE